MEVRPRPQVLPWVCLLGYLSAQLKEQIAILPKGLFDLATSQVAGQSPHRLPGFSFERGA